MMDTIDSLRRALAELVTLDQAARMAGVSEATVRRAYDAGEIDGVRSPELGKRLVLRGSAERWAEARAARLAA